MRRLAASAAVVLGAWALFGCAASGEEAGSPFATDDGVRYEVLSEAHKQHAMKVVDQALAQYPAGFVASLKVDIVPVSGLELEGVHYAGLSNNRSVLLDVKWKEQWGDYDLFCTMHHELGHVLLERYRGRFPEGAWRAQLPPGFAYRSDGPQEKAGVGHGSSSYDMDIRDVRAGFLTDEGRESIDEDFACVSEELFQNHEIFWLAVGMSARLAKKVELAVGFYHSVDARFTMEYFKGLAQPYADQTRALGMMWGGK